MSPDAAESHGHVSDDLIDGSVDPELIPDNSAYRLWFSAVALRKDATEEQRSVQQGQLAPLELNSEEVVALIDILADFRERFEVLVIDQRADAEQAATWQETPDDEAFFAKRDSLVQDVLANIKAHLTAPAFARLDAYIQKEKKNMKLSAVTR
jgi:hypothetical protein